MVQNCCRLSCLGQWVIYPCLWVWGHWGSGWLDDVPPCVETKSSADGTFAYLLNHEWLVHHERAKLIEPSDSCRVQAISFLEMWLSSASTKQAWTWWEKNGGRLDFINEEQNSWYTSIPCMWRIQRRDHSRSLADQFWNYPIWGDRKVLHTKQTSRYW